MISSNCQLSTLHHGQTSDAATTQAGHDRYFEETQISSNELGSNVTPFPQLCTPTALDPSFHAQRVNHSLSTASHAQTQPETTSSVLDPSSHVENIDSAFPDLAGSLHDSTSVGNDRCSQSFDALSSFNPSSYAQNVHFTTLDPSEHVQACAFRPQSFTPLIPATTDTYLEQNTTYPIMDTAGYDSSTSVQLAALQSEIRAQDFVPSGHSSDQHIRSIECMEYLVPEIESRPQQMNTPNDTDHPTCSQPTGAWQLGYQPQNFMIPV